MYRPANNASPTTSNTTARNNLLWGRRNPSRSQSQRQLS